MRYFYLLLILSIASLDALDLSEEKRIHQVIDHFSHAWNDNAGVGCSHYYAQDADFVNIFGTAFAGKEEIESRHIQICATFLKGSTFDITKCRLREVFPGLVIAHVYWKVTKTDATTMQGIFTHVIVNAKGNWEITASQNTQTKSS